MNDGKVSITSTLAWVTWGVSGALFLIATILIALVGNARLALGMLLCTAAVIAAGAAATLHVRSFLCSQADRIKMAYRMGCDKGRLEAFESGVASLQRVP